MSAIKKIVDYYKRRGCEVKYPSKLRYANTLLIVSTRKKHTSGYRVIELYLANEHENDVKIMKVEHDSIDAIMLRSEYFAVLDAISKDIIRIHFSVRMYVSNLDSDVVYVDECLRVISNTREMG